MTFDKTTVMGQMLAYDPEIAGVLIANGMHCVGCPSVQQETLEEACQVHNLDPDKVLGKINSFLKSKEEPRPSFFQRIFGK